jgi:phosphatidylserine decarboxylase
VRIGLTSYGLREVLISTVLAAAVGALLTWLFWPLVVLPVAVWLWVLWFFRDPRRQVPPGDGLLLSPADGKVTDITPVGPDCELGVEGVRIGIFMSVFNAHVNRSPAEATVQEITHHDGSFFDARDPRAAERNESATIRLGYRHGERDYPLVVRQIAGLVARRIVTDLAPGRALRAGERIGMIKFGSRVELMVPWELIGDVRVNLGDRVRAGLSVLVEVRQGGDDA